MALNSLSALDKHKAEPFAPGYPDNARTFYSPVDSVQEALVDLLNSSTKSLVVAMYGYDDEKLNLILQEKLLAEQIFVGKRGGGRGGGGKKRSGHSETHAIMHLKMVIVDGLDVITGSTNWSTGGESRQDNQLTVIRDPLVAAEARTRIDIIHDDMLKQMAAKRQPAKKAAPRRP